MKSIGVFFGSRSPEHDISIITAQLILSGLRGLDLPVVPVYLTRDGAWMIDESLGAMAPFTDPQQPIETRKEFQRYFLDLERSRGRLVFRQKGWRGREVIIDIAFPATHGAYGEDGTLQGLFEMLDIPYVGCGVPASALAMDKALTKILCKAQDIPTTNFFSFSKHEWIKDPEAILARATTELRWPLFVKPVHLGSSIGISKVDEAHAADMRKRIDVAMYYDTKVLIEEGVSPVMDITCCVIGHDTVRASLLQESVFQKDLFSFEDKYLQNGGAQLGKAENSLVIPARLDSDATQEIQETALKVYRLLGCSGIARVDFLYNPESKAFFANEVNPLPGTLYHHLWKKSGLALSDLLVSLLRFAEERHRDTHSVTHAFSSSVLRQGGLQKMRGSKSSGLRGT